MTLMNTPFAEALNAQINCELAASVTYLQLASDLASDSRPGMAHWMHEQAQEEAEHARQFINFVTDRGGTVTIGEIPAPTRRQGSPSVVFGEALLHEQKVTEKIHALYRLAQQVGDLESLPFLHGFLTEQTEEESTIQGICERIERVRDDEVGLLLIDQELSTRGRG